MKTKKIAYFDNASTTPMNKAVFRAMLPYFREKYGNPANLYTIGRQAKETVTRSTLKISRVLNCHPDEFIYTASATEADNLALMGIARANRNHGNRIIISAIEHKGIFAVSEALKKDGFEIIILPVNKNGLVDLDILKKSLNDKTILISITMADSETGTLQPIKEIAKIIRGTRAIFNTQINVTPAQMITNHKQLPYFHTDASQAATYSDINVNKLGVDLMTISAHKLGGPKGIGGLYIRKGVKIEPIIYGGGQQKSLRSGTENVPAIVGFGVAIDSNARKIASEYKRVKRLRDTLERGIFGLIPKVRLNGHKTKRLPNFLNISIPDIEGEAILLSLDEFGIVVNTGSACNAENLKPSYVLSAMGNPYEFIHGSIRFTLGETTTVKDVNRVLKYLPGIVARLRKISPLNIK